MPVCGAQAILPVPEPAPQSGWAWWWHFGYISLFPLLLLFPVWEKMSTCGEAEHNRRPQHGVASSIETRLI